MSTETYMTWVVALIVNSVIFGSGMALVLSVPELAAEAGALVPVVIAASVLFAWPIASYIAPRLRLRWRREQTLPLRRF